MDLAWIYIFELNFTILLFSKWETYAQIDIDLTFKRFVGYNCKGVWTTQNFQTPSICLFTYFYFKFSKFNRRRSNRQFYYHVFRQTGIFAFLPLTEKEKKLRKMSQYQQAMLTITCLRGHDYSNRICRRWQCRLYQVPKKGKLWKSEVQEWWLIRPRKL